MPSILLVDDSPVARRLNQVAFEAAGFDVIEAEDGGQAISCLRDRPEIVLVVSDLNMPGIGGMGLLARIRQEAHWAQLPVILLTVEMDPVLVERARELGASAWAVKPCKPTRLVQVAVGLLSAPPEQPGCASPGEPLH